MKPRLLILLVIELFVFQMIEKGAGDLLGGWWLGFIVAWFLGTISLFATFRGKQMGGTLFLIWCIATVCGAMLTWWGICLAIIEPGTNPTWVALFAVTVVSVIRTLLIFL